MDMDPRDSRETRDAFHAFDPFESFFRRRRRTIENDARSVSPPSSPPTAMTPLVPDSIEERLLELTNTSNYSIVQRNGQRIYGGPPPDWEGEPPERGCEVFVGKVPRDCFEDEIVPIFSKVGPIYEMRLMMDFSGSNRGYFFVRYTDREHAKRAVKELNNYEIRPGKKVGVIHSVDNRKLWISGIPKNRTAEEIKCEMERLTDGVRDVILYPSQMDKSKTRGYAFVEYDTHRCAALARRKLVPGKVVLFGHEIEKVDWAEPEVEVDEEIMKTVRVLHIRNLLPATTEATIRDKFTMLSNGGVVEHVKKTKDFAFVHFAERKSAETAKDNSANLRIEGSPIAVQWSKPVDKHNYNARKQLTRLLTQNGPNVYDRSQHVPLIEMPDGNGRSSAFFMGGARGPAAGGIGMGPRRRGAPGTAPPRRLVKFSGLNPNATSFGGVAYPNGNGFGGPLVPLSSPPPPNGLPLPALGPPGPPYANMHSFAQAQMAAYLCAYGAPNGFGGMENGFGSAASSSASSAASNFSIEQAMINLSIQQQQ